MMKLVPQGSGKKFQAEESKMKRDRYGLYRGYGDLSEE